MLLETLLPISNVLCLILWHLVDYIVKKLDDAAPNLPEAGNADDWGRATSTAAKAIKGRVLLYAASDLWNRYISQGTWKVIHID